MGGERRAGAGVARSRRSALTGDSRNAQPGVGPPAARLRPLGGQRRGDSRSVASIPQNGLFWTRVIAMAANETCALALRCRSSAQR